MCSKRALPSAHPSSSCMAVRHADSIACARSATERFDHNGVGISFGQRDSLMIFVVYTEAPDATR